MRSGVSDSRWCREARARRQEPSRLARAPTTTRRPSRGWWRLGGLIARVDTGPAFPIGSNSQPITMPANGRLYLGINDDEFGDNSGAFTVVINR